MTMSVKTTSNYKYLEFIQYFKELIKCFSVIFRIQACIRVSWHLLSSILCPIVRMGVMFHRADFELFFFFFMQIRHNYQQNATFLLRNSGVYSQWKIDFLSIFLMIHSYSVENSYEISVMMLL